MLLPILTTVGLAAAIVWFTFFAARYLFPRLSVSRQASRERIAGNPGDYVRAWAVRVAPSRLRLQQQTVKARRDVVRARAEAVHILTAFKDGKAPTLRFKITAISMFALWLVAVMGAFLLDLPIINAVSGGNGFYGFLGALLLLGVPIIGSVLLGHFFSMWRRGNLGELPFSVLATLILAAVAIVFALLTLLAPIRAQVEYADKIRAAEQQLTQYQDDGDQAAVSYAKQNLSDLQTQEQRSAQWNSALVPIAAVSEFATGFFVPLALPVLALDAARRSQRKGQRVLDTAQDRENNQRTRQYRRLSRTFRRAGLPQAELQRHFAAVAAETQNGHAPAETIEGARAAVAEEPQAQAQSAPEAPAPAPAPTSSAQTAASRSTGAADAPLTPPNGRPASDLHWRPAASAPAPSAASAPAPEPDVPDESFDLS